LAKATARVKLSRAFEKVISLNALWQITIYKHVCDVRGMQSDTLLSL